MRKDMTKDKKKLLVKLLKEYKAINKNDEKIYKKLFDQLLKTLKPLLDDHVKYGVQKDLSDTAVNTFKKLSNRLIPTPANTTQQYGSRVNAFDQHGLYFADIVGLNVDGNMIFFVNPNVAFDSTYQWILIREDNGKVIQRFNYFKYKLS